MKRVRIGVIGCGVISGIYFQNLTNFEAVEVVACADLNAAAAQAVVDKYPSIKAVSTEALLADPTIEIVLNLTQPKFHNEVMRAGIAAGKHVYGEKPLAVEFEESAEMMVLAEKAGVRVGCAPDTFLGAGIQTCRTLIDEGAIGEPIAATAFFTSHGVESWHPAPGFYYERGGGPMLDMGPYYLTALVNFLGPARSVSGSSRATFAERTITSEPLNGTKIEVETPTHISGTVDFASGAIGTVLTTFDIWGAKLPFIEIYGSEGSLSVPNPNNFGDPVQILSREKGEWEDVPYSRPFSENSRGLGVADMAASIASGEPHRASGALASHVLEILHAFNLSSESGKRIDLTTTCDRPAPLPVDLLNFG
ncbi:MAG: Gfo/Idh/MocA family oxidoreductase [Chloroflexi bacterium]|jgi:predicted dehydrogenase|nr:Gfo/Idh/MocA family oxidoreductase [Chloroflexota bacterium]